MYEFVLKATVGFLTLMLWVNILLGIPLLWWAEEALILGLTYVIWRWGLTWLRS